ncbi:MAG: hypothetical protein IJ557_07760 [Bacteroidaceae bacterium]|nr:hypothetical protein [Bacteroidaceae bacterium]
MSKHKPFIQSSIDDILDDVVHACNGAIVPGIDSFAVCEYIFQTIFLKMTGYQEQKMKCICWEVATEDFVFRKDYLENLAKYGEMSTYESKNFVYKSLVKNIQKHHPEIIATAFIDKEKTIDNIKDKVIRAFDGTELKHGNRRHFDEFQHIYDETFRPEFFAKGNTELLAGQLYKMYQVLYDHRNRCAHNLKSYQQNLPTLKSLTVDTYRYENYYLRFSLLMLIDQIMVTLYNYYDSIIVK